MRKFVETVKRTPRREPAHRRDPPEGECAAVLFVPVYFWWRCFDDTLIPDVV